MLGADRHDLAISLDSGNLRWTLRSEDVHNRISCAFLRLLGSSTGLDKVDNRLDIIKTQLTVGLDQ